MNDYMTPEQWNSLVGILISSVGGLAGFMGVMGGLIYYFLKTRINNYAKSQEAEREKIRDETKLKFVELEADTKREERLFGLVQDHAKSYEIVAKTSEDMGKILLNNTAQVADNTAQIEIIGSAMESLQQTVAPISGNVTDLVGVVNAVIKQVIEHMAQNDALYADLRMRDESSTSDSTQGRQEILQAVRNLKSDMVVLQAVKADLDIIKGKVSHLVDTKPIPQLDDDGNLVEATNGVKSTDNSTHANENDNKDKKDIA